MSERGWQLDRRVSVGHIVTTLAVALGFVVWMQRLEADVLLNEQAAALHSVRVDRLEARTEAQFREIKDMLARIEQKLDRKADR